MLSLHAFFKLFFLQDGKAKGEQGEVNDGVALWWGGLGTAEGLRSEDKKSPRELPAAR